MRAAGMRGIRGAVAAAVAAAMLTAVQPVDHAAAAGKQRVVTCRRPAICWPTAFAFTPDGRRLFYVERFTGEIRRVNLRTRVDRRWARIRGVGRAGEQGVLGLALHPRWNAGPRAQWVYVYYTQADPLRNRIVRLRRDGRRTIVRRVATIPAAGNHNGGTIRFGPDRKLYAVTGDAGRPGLAQRRTSLAGKVLRLEPNGDRPRTNPIPRSKAFSFGHRNSFGFAFDPFTGRLWQSENGPQCDDELNLVRGGRNYGWGPASACPGTSESGPNPVQPKLRWNPVIAPTGVAFCRRCGLGARVEGDVLVGSYVDSRIRRVSLNARRTRVTGQSVLLRHGDIVLALERAPSGRVYFSDRRGIYRLRR